MSSCAKGREEERKICGRKRRRVIISCYNAGTETNTGQVLPVGFGWVNDLISLKDNKKRKLIALLHGECLKYGLKNSVYKAKFGTNNPFKKLLQNWATNDGVSIKICNLCLTQNGYTVADILPFVQPVPFSIQYIINQQSSSSSKPAVVIYDSPQSG